MANFTLMAPDESFYVTIPDKADEPVIMTSYHDTLSDYENKVLSDVLKANPELNLYSVIPSESDSTDNLTLERIDELATGLHSSLTNILTMNGLVRRYIITDDVIGKVYESIESNVNTEYRLSYGDYSDKRNKLKKLDHAKQVVEEFNRQINLKHIIRESIPIAYAEGNCILCLRTDGDHYVVDRYPLGLAYISDYEYGGKPIVCIDMNELENRLQKTYEKDKKNKPIFFKNIEEDIKNNFPPEVYESYKSKNSICRLDIEYTGVIRISNLGRKYGVSPVARALKSALMLENYEKSDFTNAKAKAKKIIHQKMRKETMGENYKQKGFDVTAKAHNDIFQAWKNKTVLYTSIPQVESVAYIEPKAEETNADKINVYRSKIMTTLGIGFADQSNANFSISKISLDQLMKTINAISEQLERIIEGWYAKLFEEEGIDREYLPTIQILDAEAMSIDVKKDIVELIFSKLNGSYQTAYEFLGLSFEDEKQRRMAENDNKIDQIFMPHASQYTSSGDSGGEAGRPPSSDNTDKQARDQVDEESQ